MLREFGDSLNKIESETIQTDKEQTIRPFFLEEKDKKVFFYLLRRKRIEKRKKIKDKR
ncbi:hypothetical protein GCM10022423_35560 [Flavobacterium ginsengiterrae]|uniref:Uncharacterized protein n=1 Tax=Flavobacterium ginsengiterrae TaxID=871695 RepID=A0ABP7GZG0_9FLAO